jgi:hypothetical protein
MTVTKQLYNIAVRVAQIDISSYTMVTGMIGLANAISGDIERIGAMNTEGIVISCAVESKPRLMRIRNRSS